MNAPLRVQKRAYENNKLEKRLLRLTSQAIAQFKMIEGGDKIMDNSARLCYAESHDGRNWKRKMLSVAEFGGARVNNIVYLSGVAETGGSGVTVFKDPSAPED